MSYYRILTYQSVNGAKPKVTVKTQNNRAKADKFFNWVIANAKTKKGELLNPNWFRKMLIRFGFKAKLSLEYKVELRKVKLNEKNGKLIEEHRSQNYKH